MSLKFDNNWRRALLLTQSDEYDIDTPAEYVALDRKRLPITVAKFCEDNWEKVGFDYDTYSMLLWPLHDDIKCEKIVAEINKKFPKSASIIKTTPEEAHGLSFSSGLDFTGLEE